MGDRTFSADDVIRIYEFFLTSSEQETVDFFFAPEEEPEEPPEPSNILARLIEIAESLSGLRTFFPRFLPIVIRFAIVLLPIFSLASIAVTNATRVLNELIEEETSA